MIRMYQSTSQGAAANPSAAPGYSWKLIYCLAWINVSSTTGNRSINIMQKPFSGSAYLINLIAPLSDDTATSGDLLLAAVGVGFSSVVSATGSVVASLSQPIPVGGSSIDIVWGLQTGDTSGFELCVDEIMNGDPI